MQTLFDLLDVFYPALDLSDFTNDARLKRFRVRLEGTPATRRKN